MLLLRSEKRREGKGTAIKGRGPERSSEYSQSVFIYYLHFTAKDVQAVGGKGEGLINKLPNNTKY